MSTFPDTTLTTPAANAAGRKPGTKHGGPSHEDIPVMEGDALKRAGLPVYTQDKPRKAGSRAGLKAERF